MLNFYTDGSAAPTNPGPKGGFGVVVLDEDFNVIETCSNPYLGGKETTNNREEMLAIIWAILYAKSKGEQATIYSDSAYAINAFSTWIYGWARNGWTKANGGHLENLDIIQFYWNYCLPLNPIFQKVKGHSNLKHNELADRLAKGEII